MSRRRDVLASGPSSRDLLLVAFAVLAYALPALADVTVQERTVSTGLLGFGNGISTTTLVIAGDRSRKDAEQTYTGRFKTFAGGGKPKATSEIARLDRETAVQKAHADAEKEKATARTDEQKEDAEAKSQATASLAKGNLGGALGGMLGRKLGRSTDNKAAASMPSESDDGSDGGIKIVTDVLDVSTGASGASFEPPAGYKKVERRK